ncbi:hypothetical protein GO302_04233 [Ralstonia solanacearum]|nr:hypothetical protein [Ralstonia solanacearum]NKA50826.1 hypothetical protein [Ralstonia solanacearum]NKB15195.1 hypothetical protein [Ralstonia solanacearum]
MIAVRMHRATGAHHQCGLAALDRRTRMQRTALRIALLRAVRHGIVHDREVVTVKRGVGARVARGVLRVGAGQRAQRLRQHLAKALVEVVACPVQDGQHGEARLAVVAVLIMINQLEARAQRQRAHAAFAVELLVAQLQRFHHQAHAALGLGAVFEPVLPGVVGVLQRQLRDAIAPLLRAELGAALGVGAVVPTGDRHGVGLPAPHALPAVDHVFIGGGIGAAEADRGLRVVGEGIVGIGDHHAVHAQRIALDRLVLEEVEQPFLGQQAGDEVEIAFFVLRDDAAARVHRGIAQRPAPRRRQAALAVVVAEQAVDHFDHRLVLEQEAVAPVAQEGQPGFDHQPVAHQAAVGAQLLEPRDVAMERPQRAAALLGQQVEPDGLPQQARRIEIGVIRQRGQLQPEAAIVEMLGGVQPLGQQRVRPERRVQAQQPIGPREGRPQQVGQLGR